MIKFECIGVIQAVAQNRERADSYYMRVMPDGRFTFPRQGELPAPINVKCGEVAKTFQVGQVVKITGDMAVGVHEWKKPKKFGQEVAETKDIHNTYFNAVKIEVQK